MNFNSAQNTNDFEYKEEIINGISLNNEYKKGHDEKNDNFRC